MISLLIINYRSATLAAEAVRTARETASGPLDVVVVDNSVDAVEAESLRRVADTLVISPTNRGYAGGINDGMRACRGQRVVISNPDVRYAAHAIDELVAGLSDAAVAGPALFWDDALQWHLPPGDLSTGWEKIDALLASRSAQWRDQWDARRIRRRMAFWSLTETTRVPMLSGAVLAVRRDVFDQLAGFDERFALYFEENDFLRRVAERRLRIVHVPAAKCRHIYNQSAAQVAAESAARFAESELRYLEKWNGPLAARVLRRFERALSPREAIPHSRGEPIRTSQPVLMEASPLATFATAAGRFAGPGDVTMPEEIIGSLRGELFVRVVGLKDGQPLATYKITA